MNDVVAVQHVAQSYGKKQILRDVSLCGAPGERIGIVGVNGSGKSTLLRILAGLQKPAGGEVHYYGHDMWHEKKMFRRLVGYVPQENPLLEELRAADNLKLWGDIGSDAATYVMQALEITPLMRKKVATLSGGMKRRLSIACALIGGQSILIMDEPTAALDLHQKELIERYISQYLQGNGIIIQSTHDVEEIRACTALYYLHQGAAHCVDAEEAIEALREEIR